MPIKLIGVIILMVFVAVFTGFNLDNRCPVWPLQSFGEIPVFVTIIASFVLGVLVTLPFTFGKRAPKEPKSKEVRRGRKRRGAEDDVPLPPAVTGEEIVLK